MAVIDIGGTMGIFGSFWRVFKEGFQEAMQEKKDEKFQLNTASQSQLETIDNGRELKNVAAMKRTEQSSTKKTDNKAERYKEPKKRIKKEPDIISQFKKESSDVNGEPIYWDVRDNTPRIRSTNSQIRTILFFDKKEGFLLYCFDNPKAKKLTDNVEMLVGWENKTIGYEEVFHYYDRSWCYEYGREDLIGEGEYVKKPRHDRSEFNEKTLAEHMCKCRENQGVFLEIYGELIQYKYWELKKTLNSFSIRSYLEKGKGIILDKVKIMDEKEGMEVISKRTDLKSFQCGTRLTFSQRRYSIEDSEFVTERVSLDVFQIFDNRILETRAAQYLYYWTLVNHIRINRGLGAYTLDQMRIGLKDWADKGRYQKVYSEVPLEQFEKLDNHSLCIIEKIENLDEKDLNAKADVKRCIVNIINRNSLEFTYPACFETEVISLKYEMKGNKKVIVEADTEFGVFKPGQRLIIVKKDISQKDFYFYPVREEDLPYQDLNYEKAKQDKKIGTRNNAYKAAWDTFLEFVYDEDVKQRCYDWMEEHPDDLPDTRGYELEEDGEIVGEAEVAWVKQKRAILSKEQEEFAPLFIAKGWKIES